MTNALVTWASGQDFCRSDGFKVWLASSKENVNADRFVFTHDMPDDVRTDLLNQEIQIVDVNPKEVHFLLRDRHLHFWQWLTSIGYDNFGFTDAKDVVFQSDPFKHLGVLGGRIILTCEGMEQDQSPWNQGDWFQAQIDTRQFKFPYTERPVINGGVVFGDRHCLKNHFLLLWMTTLKSLGQCTDQGVLNILYNFLEKHWEYEVTDPRSDNFCLTGEAAKHGLVDYLFQNNCLKNDSGEDYCIVHQWDRIPNVNTSLKDRWLKE